MHGLAQASKKFDWKRVLRRSLLQRAANVTGCGWRPGSALVVLLPWRGSANLRKGMHVSQDESPSDRCGRCRRTPRRGRGPAPRRRCRASRRSSARDTQPKDGPNKQNFGGRKYKIWARQAAASLSKWLNASRVSCTFVTAASTSDLLKASTLQNRATASLRNVPERP
jgi:hypothetical protein